MALYRKANGSHLVDPAAYDYLLELTKPGFAWEFARRNHGLQRAALHCRPGRPRTLRIGRKTCLYRLRRRYPAAERFGLHHIPDPHLSASEVTPFWLPRMMTSAIHLRLMQRRLARTRRFDLGRLPGSKHILVPVTGPPEMVLQGDHYAGYFSLDGRWRLLPRRFFMQVGLSAFDEFPAQIDAATRLFDASADQVLSPWRERAYGPKRMRRAVLAYDIRTKYHGSHWDAARVIYGVRRTEEARKRGDDSLRERARRAFRAGHTLIHDGWRRLLH
ncbi:transcriptional regulator domain-containing protein [Erythrobacter aureus]|uniref:transcriptional regulator domain-containing protein n=1 Tax=Erythrobacter aureus TaxID=2182384 RepID=UPI003A9189CF